MHSRRCLLMLDSSSMASKQFISEQQLINDSFRLGVQIYNSGFRPTFVVGLWRGGSSVGIYVQECLQYLGIETNHIAVRTSYTGVESYQRMVADPDRNIRVHGTQYLLEALNADDRLLLVDDVWGSGSTLRVVIRRLRSRLKRNMPSDVRRATVWSKADTADNTDAPDYCVHQTSDWLVLPYELTGLTDTELAEHKPQALELIKALRRDA